MNFLTVFLARFFDSLKIKNQILYFFLASIVVVLNLAVNNVVLQDLYVSTFGELPSWFNTVLQIVSVLYLAVTAPRTTEVKEQARVDAVTKKYRNL